jgi:hypothetical protein
MLVNFNFLRVTARRSQYLLKYNAVDSSGNEAEEVFFTLVLDDKIPPLLSTPSSQSGILEIVRMNPLTCNYYACLHLVVCSGILLERNFSEAVVDSSYVFCC